MSSRLLAHQLTIDGNDVTIQVEVDSASLADLRTGDLAAVPRSGERHDLARKGRAVFTDGLELIKNCAAAAVGKLNELKETMKPDEFELQLAVKLDAEAGAFLTRLGGEAQLQVTMKWLTRPDTVSAES